MISDDAFGHWFAGLADGEGCFHIKRVGTAYICAFIIGLRRDDRPILEEIRDWTGLGNIFTVRRPGATIRWEIARKAECAALVDIFDRYPLRARKARDYALWREAVILWQEVVPRQRANWRRIEHLKETLEAGRRPLCTGQV